MTDQPVKPTPGPTGPWRAKPWDELWEAAAVLEDKVTVCEVFGEPEIATARAELFAAAPAMTAERDRLGLEIEQCHAKSTCCCGDYMKHHSTYSGHNPVSMYDNALFNIEAGRDRLAAALDGLILVCGRTGESLKDFEEQAAAFQRETGKMRPGKDVPMTAADLGATPEEYRYWVDGKVSEAHDALDQARKPETEGKGK
jgi:hypothetical protein